MRVYLEGVGLLGPGLNGWEASRALLAGTAAYAATPTIVTASDLLPAAERRRTGLPVKLALAAGRAAFVHAGRQQVAERPDAGDEPQHAGDHHCRRRIEG